MNVAHSFGRMQLSDCEQKGTQVCRLCVYTYHVALLSLREAIEWPYRRVQDLMMFGNTGPWKYFEDSAQMLWYGSSCFGIYFYILKTLISSGHWSRQCQIWR